MFANAGIAMAAVPADDELAERRLRRVPVLPVDGLAAAQVVSVVEQVEALQPEQDRRGLRRLDPALDEGGDVLGAWSRGRPTCSAPAPFTTGRSLLAPSPLLSTPVVELNGRAEASMRQRADR